MMIHSMDTEKSRKISMLMMEAIDHIECNGQDLLSAISLMIRFIIEDSMAPDMWVVAFEQYATEIRTMIKMRWAEATVATSEDNVGNIH